MGSAFGSAIEPYEFASEVEETRFRALAEELRCTVCQNQSLADSDAPLAQDLRRELYGMISRRSVGHGDTKLHGRALW